MPPPLFIIGLVSLIIGLFGSRYLGERSLKLLSAEEKLKLLDSFSVLRAFGALPLLLIFFAFFGVGYLPQSTMWPAYFSAWGLVAAYFTVIHVFVTRKMRVLGINENFLAAHSRARWLSYCGFIAFFVLNTISPVLSR